MGSPLVSVVIPVFNGAEYLQECLESVVTQTYSSWEATVVNNCSSDRTGEIAEAMCRRDNRLKVTHCKEFVGQAENYNRAISHASREARYVKVLEADNHLMPQCLERMIAVAETDQRIGMVGSYYLHGRTLRGAGLPIYTSVLEGTTACRLHLTEKMYFFGTPTSVLFQTAALRGITPAFNPALFYDDVDLCFRLMRTWKFGFVHQVLAFVREDNGGIYSQFSDFEFQLPLLWLLCKQYGDACLEPSERHRIQADFENRYRLQLGRAILGGRKREYWDFHSKVFQLAGLKLDWSVMFRPTVGAFLDMLLNPKSTVELLLKRIARKRDSSTQPTRKQSDSIKNEPRCVAP